MEHKIIKTYYVASEIKNKCRYYVGKRGRLTRSISLALKWKSKRIAKFYVKVANWGLGKNYSVCEVRF